MEIKYEPVFGPQHLFKLPSTEIIVVGPHGDKTESNIDLMIGNTPDDYVIVAMRRIIKTQVIGYDESEFEDELEALYWHFDTDKKTGARSERDIFKGKVRYLINKFTQPKKTPVWTVADQKAGGLPEVGCLVVNKTGKVSEVVTIKNGYFVLFECGKNNGPLTIHGDLLMNQFKPIETTTEKAARLREEWVSKATFMKTYEIYDDLLSGKLPMPGKDAK